ncbi:MAG: site-specific integrase [Deltaproteobacteria bacterium]|nr:site-specific integrase [Deltaproteobacteria bacterium]
MACVTKRRGRYVIDYYDNQGKRRWETLKKGTTKKKALDRLREIEDQLSRGTYVPEKKIPRLSEVCKEWLEFKKPNVRASYLSTCEGITRNHFKDLEHLKVNRITTAMVEKWIRGKQEDGMHLLTLRKSIVIFNQIMAYAVRHGYTVYNPVRDAERPRDQGKVQKKKIRILTPDEIKAFLDAVEDRKYKILFKLAIMSGARQGELLGLKWSDVDWENNQIHIQRTFNNQKWYATKTATSNRRIDLGPAMMTELKKWKLACPSNPMGLMFPNEAGGPINQSNMRSRYFEPALKAAGIGKVRFHDLRHTYASLMIEQGENVKYIQTQLGHSSPMVTLNVYTHLMKATNQEAALRLEKAIF